MVKPTRLNVMLYVYYLSVSLMKRTVMRTKRRLFSLPIYRTFRVWYFCIGLRYKRNFNCNPKYTTRNVSFFCEVEDYVRGGIQNIPDWRCKNHKTHHTAYRPPSPSKKFPPACRHLSHRLLHFWNASWKSFAVRVSSTLCESAWIPSGSGIKPASFQLQFQFWK
jgi:hypothetical protein